MKDELVNPGDYAVTPWTPVGLVKVIALSPSDGIYDESALVVYLHEHYGYPALSTGWYQRHELRRVDPEVVEIIDDYYLTLINAVK